MHRWSMNDEVRERHKELIAEAARHRLAAQSRSAYKKRRISGRVRVARALRALGYVLLDAGHSLESESWRSA